jgi:hypothetical protein
MVAFLLEFVEFAKRRKKLWMIPVLAAMIAFGFLLLLASHPVVTPFIYSLF